MVKLTKAIIKKYGISKKAWAVARGKGKKRNTIKIKSVNKRGASKMAKKRRSSKKVKVKSGMEKIARSLFVPAMAIGYGYARDKLSDGLNGILLKTKLGQNIPATAFTDELIMLGANFGLGKTGVKSNWYGMKALQVAKHQELGRIGSTFSDMQQQKKTNSNTAW